MWTIIYYGLATLILLIIAAVLCRESGLIWIILLLVALSVSLLIFNVQKLPNGLPVELRADGQYEVQPVDNYVDKEGKKWVVVLVLTEGGKTIEGLKPYRKIPHSKFGCNNVIIGIPMTITLKTHESYQELIVKKDY